MNRTTLVFQVPGTDADLAVNRTTLVFQVPGALNSVSRQSATVLNSNVVVVANGGAGAAFRAYLFSPGPMTAGELLLSIPVSTAIRFQIGLPESRAVTETTGAMSSATFVFRRNGTQFASATFAPGATSATFSSPIETDFSPNDILSVVAPSPADPSLLDVGLSLIGILL